MEQPTLVQRAQSVIDIAVDSLERPDLEQNFQEYHGNIGPEYVVELRSHQSPGNPSGRQSTRYAYLNGPHLPGRCRPVVSLDIDKLVQENEVSGLVDDFEDILLAVNQAVGGEEEGVEFLNILYANLILNNSETDPEHQNVSALHESFIKLLSKGSLATLRSLTVKSPEDQARLHVSSCTILGSLQHVKQPFTHMPQITVALRREGDSQQTVLGINEFGKLESWVEVADKMERMASYAEPENVMRDSNGKLLAVSGAGLDSKERAFVNTERAAGLRELKIGRVALVETYVKNLLSPLTDCE